MPHCRTFRTEFLLLPFCLLLGCSDGTEEDVPPLQPVSGTVMFGGEPTKGIAVSFMPTGQTAGGMAYGATDAEGCYTLSYRNGEPGVPAGTYTAIFSKMVTPNGEPIPEGKTAADVGAVNVIPPRFRDATSSPAEVSVPEGGGEFDFEIPAP